MSRGRVLLSVSAVLAVAAGLFTVAGRGDGRKAITNEAEFRQAMKDLSNWGRWGPDDELGASNLITPAKRNRPPPSSRKGYRFRWRTT